MNKRLIQQAVSVYFQARDHELEFIKRYMMLRIIRKMSPEARQKLIDMKKARTARTANA